MDFTREKLNELLYYMQVDNPKYGLISKILYVYGRKVKEVFNLQKRFCFWVRRQEYCCFLRFYVLTIHNLF